MSKPAKKKKAVPKIRLTLDKLDLDVEALAGIAGGASGKIPWIIGPTGKVIQKGTDPLGPSTPLGFCPPKGPTVYNGTCNCSSAPGCPPTR